MGLLTVCGEGASCGVTVDSKDVTLQAVLAAGGGQAAYTADMGLIDSDAKLRNYAEGGGRVVVGDVLDKRTNVLEEELYLLRTIVERLQDEKLALFEQIKQQTREMAIQKHRIAELDGTYAKIPVAKVVSLLAAPQEAPLCATMSFSEQLSGNSLERAADGMSVKATHSYNKIALCEPGFDSEHDTYAEFLLKTNFAKYTCIGVVMEEGLDRVNIDTDSLGEHPYSYAWGGHKYWTASFITDGASKGPKGGEWVKGSRIGVLVSSGAISFYLDSQLRHQHVFTNVCGRFRFGVSFGGPKSPDGEYGTIEVVV